MIALVAFCVVGGALAAQEHIAAGANRAAGATQGQAALETVLNEAGLGRTVPHLAAHGLLSLRVLSLAAVEHLTRAGLTLGEALLVLDTAIGSQSMPLHNHAQGSNMRPAVGAKGTSKNVDWSNGVGTVNGAYGGNTRDSTGGRTAVNEPHSQVRGLPPPLRGHPAVVTDFGAVGDGVSDDTTAIEAAVDAALAEGEARLVLFPAGTYRITRTINASGSAGEASFTPCSFAAMGAASATTLLMDPAGDRRPPQVGTSASRWAERPAEPPTGLQYLLAFRGGSGALTQAYVRDLTLAGLSPGAGAAGVLFNSQDGVSITGCVLRNLTVGVHFANTDGGGFAEYCQVVRSQFLQVQTGLLYTRDQGTGSFHGSGMVGCTANWVGPTPFIWVGSPGSIVYNAPWDFQVWIDTVDPSVPVVHVNDSAAASGSFPPAAEVYTHGTVTVEAGQHDVLHFGRPVYHAGCLEMFLDANTLDRGSFWLVDSLGTNTDGSLNVVFKPYNGVVTLNPGVTTLPLVACAGGCLVASEITAPNYVWIRTHLATFDEYGGANLTELAAGRSFDPVGVGPPVFAASNPELTVSNPTFLGGNRTRCFYTVTQVAQAISQHDHGGGSAKWGRDLKGRQSSRWNAQSP